MQRKLVKEIKIELDENQSRLTQLVKNDQYNMSIGDNFGTVAIFDLRNTQILRKKFRNHLGSIKSLNYLPNQPNYLLSSNIISQLG